MSLRHFLGTFAGCASIAYTVLPNSIYLEKYRQMKAKYFISHVEEPLDQVCIDRYKEVVADLIKYGVKVKEEKIKVFCVHGYDIFSAGAMRSNYGAILGIPKSYQYSNANLLDEEDVTSHLGIVKMNPKAFNTYISSLILSPNAQMYAIAREIIKVKGRFIGFDVMNNLSSVACGYVAYNMTSDKIAVVRGNAAARFLYACTICATSFFAWMKLNLYAERNKEERIDRLLCNVHPKYIEGGKEFYKKTMDRNMSLKVLWDDNSKSKAKYDYENLLPWYRSTPLSIRLKYFSEKSGTDSKQLA